jgi:hypothetical protein
MSAQLPMACYFALFKMEITENVACFFQYRASFQDRKVRVTAVASASRVPASAMLLLEYGFERHDIHTKFCENLSTGSKVVLKSLLCMSHSARSSPFRLSFMYR